MEYKSVENYFCAYSDYFPPNLVYQLKNLLLVCKKETFEKLNEIELINPKKIQKLSVFFGFLGIDRFVIGDYVLGFLKLFTFGVVGMGWILDISEIKKTIQKQNFDKIIQIIAVYEPEL